MVSCGIRHVGFVTITLNLYMYGHSMYGQCGIVAKQPQVKTPVLVAENVNKIICNENTSFYVDIKLDMYVCGRLAWFGLNQRGFILYSSDTIDVDIDHNVVDDIAYTQETILLTDSTLHTKKIHYSNDQHTPFIQISTNIKKIIDAHTVLDYDDNVYQIKDADDTYKLILVDHKIKNLSREFKLTTNYDLYNRPLSERATPDKILYGKYKLLDENVKEFHSGEIGGVYVKNNGKVYGVGKIIRRLGIFIPKVFNDFLQSLTLEQWSQLLTQLKTRQWQDLYGSPDIDNLNMLKAEDLYEVFLNMDFDQQKDYLSRFYKFPPFYQPENGFSPETILAFEDLKYPILLANNCQHVDAEDSLVFILSTPQNNNVPRVYL